MWELDHKISWAPKIWCFWTAVLEKTLESPLDCKEIQPGNTKGNQYWIVTEGLMLKLQYFGHVMWRADSLEKTVMLGKIEGRRRRGWQRMRWLDGIIGSMTWVWAGSGSWWWTDEPGVLQPLGSQSWTGLSDWTERCVCMYVGCVRKGLRNWHLNYLDS